MKHDNQQKKLEVGQYFELVYLSFLLVSMLYVYGSFTIYFWMAIILLPLPVDCFSYIFQCCFPWGNLVFVFFVFFCSCFGCRVLHYGNLVFATQDLYIHLYKAKDLGQSGTDCHFGRGGKMWCQESLTSGSTPHNHIKEPSSSD